MDFNHRVDQLILAAVALTLMLEADGKQIDEYLDFIPQFLTDHEFSPDDDDLLYRFLQWVPVCPVCGRAKVDC
jgi:hypothetical protein